MNDDLPRFDPHNPSTWSDSEPTGWIMSMIRLAEGDKSEALKRLRQGIVPPPFVLSILADMLDDDGPGYEGARLVLTTMTKTQDERDKRDKLMFFETLILVSCGSDVVDAWNIIAKKNSLGWRTVSRVWEQFKEFDTPELRAICRDIYLPVTDFQKT
jgi:hypothetical protein